jgi:hypothetical protein
LIVAAQTVIGGGPSLEWFEAMSEVADEAEAAFNQYQHRRDASSDSVDEENLATITPGDIVRRQG